MHWLDITIFVALGIGAVFGFWSGLLWQIARVVSLLASLYVAIAANSVVADWIGQQWKESGTAACSIAAFVLVFLLVYVLLYLITQMLHKAIKASNLEFLDRLLGGLLGMVKMGAIVAGICATLTALSLPFTQTWLEQSTLALPLARGAEHVVRLIPTNYREQLDDNVQQVREQMQKKVAARTLDVLKNEARP